MRPSGRFGLKPTLPVTRIRISGRIAPELLLRQTPGNSGRWQNTQFVFDDDISQCDAWVVLDGLKKQETTLCARNNVIFITGEPPGVKEYGEKFLRQFGLLITCHRGLKHPRVINTQQALPWMIGGKYYKESRTFTYSYKNGFGFDELSNLEKCEKSRLISAIVSRKTVTDGHVARNHFIEQLKARMGTDLDIFGVGYKEIQDKFEGLSPYKYHLALENSSFPDYWTEKLTDSFLAYAYPFYYGCPNISEYFSKESMTVIDIRNVDSAIEKIENALRDNVCEAAAKQIQESRNLVLNKYNLFPMIAELYRTLRHGPIKRITLRPEEDFGRPFLTIGRFRIFFT
jgi:Glycosyltransferase family 10 (fucosyltransferase) C-term